MRSSNLLVVRTDSVKIEGVEPLLTIKEAAEMLRWSYDSVRRYFMHLDGVLVKQQSKRYKRSYRQYMIPKSVFEREWAKMANFNSQGTNRKVA